MKIQFINGETEPVEVDLSPPNMDEIQIVFINKPYDQVVQLFTPGNFEVIELYDNYENHIDTLREYTRLTSIVTMYPKKEDFWKEDRIVVVLSKN